jgi:hypothetical protein
MAGGKRNRERGAELELEVVHTWKAQGVEAQRVPLSGGAGGIFIGDVILAGYTIECKRRKDGFGVLYDALNQQGSDFLVVRADRKPRLYVIPEETMLLWHRQYGLFNFNLANSKKEQDNEL